MGTANAATEDLFRLEPLYAFANLTSWTGIDAAVAEVQARIRAGDYERMDKLNNALAAATSVVATIEKISTWPWRPETLRGFVSAVGLPILIWTITALLGRYF